MGKDRKPHYNTFQVPPKGDDYVRKEVTIRSANTKAAYDELRAISSWRDLGLVCAEQRKKRGW